MRICRFLQDNEIATGFYYDDGIAPLTVALDAMREVDGDAPAIPVDADTLDLLTHGAYAQQADAVAEWLDSHPDARGQILCPQAELTMQSPVANPRKILLLAGNYAAHIEEEGSVAVERQETFPYVFMKPHTALNHPDGDVPIPAVSPNHIDYECELGIVMGRRASGVEEADALEYVAGYTVMNDISDRKFRPNPDRREREKDVFFDWQHGKWHDRFCPVGPAVRSAQSLPDPQTMTLQLSVNGEVRQSSTTGHMIFPVAAIVAFISQWVTLEPGDLIATGTPAGVGMTTGTFLKPGDILEATIEGIGTLRNTMVG